MSAVALNQDLLKAAVSRIADDELTSLRNTALGKFAEFGFPSVKHENWRYTNLSPAAELSNAWLSSTVDEDGHSAAEDTELDQWIGDIDAHWIVVRSGKVDPKTLAAV